MNLDTIKQKIVGLSLDAAHQHKEEFGIQHIRPMQVNGTAQRGTMDFRDDRINVSIQDDKIVDVISVG